MDVLGLNPSLVIIAATLTGVVLRIVLGWSASGEKFDPKKTVSTLITGFFTGVVFVAAQIATIDAGADTQTQLVLVIGAIGTVMGLDSAIKSGTKIASAVKTKKG